MANRRNSVDGNPDEMLIASIDALRDEVRVLRDVVDELREELQYLVRHRARVLALTRRNEPINPMSRE